MQLIKTSWYLVAPPSTLNFSGEEVGLNLDLGLATSCCSRQTALPAFC